MASTNPNQDLANLRPHYQDDDTIDLGALLRGLFQQWLLIGSVTAGITVLAIIVVLMLPNKYRVEAVISQPTSREIQPLLAQSVEPITAAEVGRSFLVNIRSYGLVEAALNASGLMDQLTDGEQLSEEDKVTTIRSLRDNLTIEPVDLSFLGETDTTSLENVSVSLLSTKPSDTKRFLDELIERAAERTLTTYKNNIEAARDIRIAKIHSQINSIEQAAQTKLENRIFQLEQAASIASSLNIESPTTWESLARGADNAQYINLRDQSDNDLFLQGTRILQAQLEGLKNDDAARLFESGIHETQVITPDAANNSDDPSRPLLTSRTVSSTELRGELASLQAININLQNVSLIDADNQARVPANAEAPKRKLIVVAAFVLGGFIGIFIALIRLAVRGDETATH